MTSIEHNNAFATALPATTDADGKGFSLQTTAVSSAGRSH